ncbi:MAG: RNA 2',3'-cyclic phosphodiesterase [Dehalococcoidia bacterium]|nr:RNA 2',3'-cyclic phosphodiesterase [Dehalococcoidia bacterium]
MTSREAPGHGVRPGKERGTLRLFVAIELPDAWKQALQALQSEMQAALSTDPRTAGTRIRWVRPDGIHLTLKFLGEAPSDRLAAVQDALSIAIAAPPALELALGRVSSFSSRRAPRVVWAGIAESGAAGRLLRIVEQVETRLAAAGFPRERRGFTPHLTLARLPDDLSPASREAVAEVTAGFATPAPAPFTVDKVSLMQSHLGPGGARYERLASYPA